MCARAPSKKIFQGPKSRCWGTTCPFIFLGILGFMASASWFYQDGRALPEVSRGTRLALGHLAGPKWCQPESRLRERGHLWAWTGPGSEGTGLHHLMKCKLLWEGQPLQGQQHRVPGRTCLLLPHPSPSRSSAWYSRPLSTLFLLHGTLPLPAERPLHPVTATLSSLSPSDLLVPGHPPTGQSCDPQFMCCLRDDPSRGLTDPSRHPC